MVPSMPSTDLGCKLLLPAAIVVLHCSSLRLTRFAADNSALQGGLNGTRYEQRANAHASYYNHRPAATGLIADDYHGADPRNAGFVTVSGQMGGYIPARKEATSALQESEALVHRYRRNTHDFTTMPEEMKYLGSSPTLPANPGRDLRNFAGYAVHGEPLEKDYAMHYSQYGGLAPGGQFQKGHVHSSPRLQLEMKSYQDDCSGGQWDDRQPTAGEKAERAWRVMPRYATRSEPVWHNRHALQMRSQSSQYPLAPY